jgi:hypothetical protein
LIWPRKQGVRRLAAITVRRMARGTLDTPVRVQRAAKGDRFYTWRGRVRQLFPVDGRLVLNAYLGGELVGSAIVSSHEADEDEQRETAWTLADARFSPSGPYFGDPDLFAEPCDLHFESLYTWRDVRRRGVVAALIEAVSEIGLPTFAEFRPKWLPDVFERWRVTEENQDETLFWTQEGAGGSLGVALSPRRRAETDDLPGRDRRGRAPLRRDQRQETHAPRRHPDRR